MPARFTVALALLGCSGHHAATADAPPADTGADASDGGLAACPAGSSLAVDRTSCPGAIVAPPSGFAMPGTPGDVTSMAGLDEGNLPCVPAFVCTPDAAATILFSDDPESPASDGVLYADTFGPGHARIYVYHVDADTKARKFPIVVLNEGTSDAHITITKEGLTDPTTDYLDIGKVVATTWMASNVARLVEVPAGTRVLLDPALDGMHATTDQLVHAILDLDTDAPVKLSIVSVLATEDAAAVTASLPLLPNDGLHDRGTFAGADVWIAGRAGGEGPSARHVRIGDGTTEPELTGRDATTGADVTLHGNYGVAYRFLIAAQGSIGFAASARGGAWAGSLDDDPTITPLPSSGGGLSTTTDAVWLASGAADFTVMSGGGSSLPADVITLTP